MAKQWGEGVALVKFIFTPEHRSVAAVHVRSRDTRHDGVYRSEKFEIVSDDMLRMRRFESERQASEFVELFRMLDQPTDPRTVISGYANLMTRVTSASYRCAADRR